MFTLAIFCLNTSNLPWFMDLTFQISMQYYYLQHQTLLSPQDTYTTGHCFHLAHPLVPLEELNDKENLGTQLWNISDSVSKFLLFVLYFFYQVLTITWRLYMCVYIYWIRQWYPTPVLSPGKSHGWWCLVGCSPWGHTESGMTERLNNGFEYCPLLGVHTPVLLPGKSHGWRSLVGCSPWGR